MATLARRSTSAPRQIVVPGRSRRQNVALPLPLKAYFSVAISLVLKLLSPGCQTYTASRTVINVFGIPTKERHGPRTVERSVDVRFENR